MIFLIELSLLSGGRFTPTAGDRWPGNVGGGELGGGGRLSAAICQQDFVPHCVRPVPVTITRLQKLADSRSPNRTEKQVRSPQGLIVICKRLGGKGGWNEPDCGLLIAGGLPSFVFQIIRHLQATEDDRQLARWPWAQTCRDRNSQPLLPRRASSLSPIMLFRRGQQGLVEPHIKRVFSPTTCVLQRVLPVAFSYRNPWDD
jgi:hypothetical protein